MINFNRNNLDKALSPYLKQHQHNPIYWQEWSTEISTHAQQTNKPLFISVGYATCHWCHQMATDTFQNQEIATFLNEHFINVKVDKEQRPDIDQYLMSYTLETQGSGGWPLNVVLTSDLKPLASFSYLPSQPTQGIPSFLEVIKQIATFYDANKTKIPAYIQQIPTVPDINPAEIMTILTPKFDRVNGGFGTAPKFPLYTSLIFLIHYFERTNDQNVYGLLKKTLDAMAMGGLHDHLQGGFFRYCTDEAWIIPHFEKLLYDQALALWTYSLGYKVLKVPAYKTVAENIIRCLDETFDNENDGLYSAALGADADDKEGTSYLWNYDELTKALTAQEFTELSRTYIIPDAKNGSFIHLIKSRMDFIPDIENKLLALRKKRVQPIEDIKKITSWNAFTGIALLIAYRCLGRKDALDKARSLFDLLKKNHIKNNVVYHSSTHNELQKHGFLQDVASMLLFDSYLSEELGKNDEFTTTLETCMQQFLHDNVWYESFNTDFVNIPAMVGDQSLPSSISMAKLGLLRTAILTNKSYRPFGFKEPLLFDFMNLASFISAGNFHSIESPEKIEWQDLPINCIQRRGSLVKDCLSGECKQFKNTEELLNSLTA